ncbi:MAG: phytanoyl-CoA dioxygenase family protein [Planctomycetaceae bacterium]
MPLTLNNSQGFSPAEIEHFRRNGYVISRRLAGDELRLAMLDATLDGLNRLTEPLEFEADLHYPGAPQSRSAQGGDTVRRLKQAHSRGMAFTDWVSRPELVGRLQQLLGPRLVMPLAHHNCVMTKDPRYSSNTGWHQDIRYWSFARPDLVSVWLALGREFPQNGCLKLIPGSHAMELDRSRFDEQLFFRPEVPANRELIEGSVYAELEPGDALFFHCRTLHAADRNSTGEPKFSVVFTFRPFDNPPQPGTRSSSMPELLVC